MLPDPLAGPSAAPLGNNEATDWQLLVRSTESPGAIGDLITGFPRASFAVAKQADDNVIAKSKLSQAEAKGNDSTSQEIILALTAQNTPAEINDSEGPAIASVRGPSPKAYQAGSELAFIVSMTERVEVSGQPTLPVAIGDRVRLATWNREGNGTKNLTFTLPILEGDSAPAGVRLVGPIQLLGLAAIRDLAGNNLNPKVIGHFPQVIVDAVRPRVEAFSQPVLDASNRVVSLAVRFSEPVIVKGRPWIPFSLAGEMERLVYATGSGRKVLTFHSKPVKEAGLTVDDVTVPLQAIKTNGAKIVDQAGNRLISLAPSPIDIIPPRVVGALSTGASSVVVRFSEPMDASILNPTFFSIAHTNAEVGGLAIHKVAFADASRRAVKLVTSSQNELNYTLKVVGATDRAGNAISGPTRPGLDPAKATFAGTPPSANRMRDSDGDGLTDNVEMRGWSVSVKQVDGRVTIYNVTSDPRIVDTDGDGLSDAQEANLRFDPRAWDSDGDQISDYAEFNEIYSNALDQDTDGDGLDDFVEWSFYRTSAIFADTDGDQVADGDEISGNRNPLIADLPRPEIEIGDINLQLDVKFSESNAQERRDLETRSTSTTLSASQSQQFSKQYTGTAELKLEAGYGDGSAAGGGRFLATASGGFTYNQSEESATEATRSYERSLSTDKEVTRGFTVERNVVGAAMQVAVNLRNVSNLAYRVKNLQVTALIQDPLNHSRMTPVATLIPDNEPEEGYTLGPLVGNRGPIIFSNDTIVPSLVESLMANSSGLIFRISNYDVIDERGRNFAFISQEVVERTGMLVIDYGGATSLSSQVNSEAANDNRPGDETEILRVSTSGGRVIDDTNGDGSINEGDRRTTFDSAGKEVGITLFDALAATGMTRYNEADDPMTDLTAEEIQNSYSTSFVNGIERIYRIRGVANDPLVQKRWEILTTLGIVSQADLGSLILKTGSPISLNFVQDLDNDGLPADVEFLLRTSDGKRDTDGDGLDDRFEALIGWTVETPQRRYQVYSSPNRKDSNFDSPKPGVDSDGNGIEDLLQYDGSDLFAAPEGWDDANNNGLRDKGEIYRLNAADWVLDPIKKDTDGDGINDATELIGFTITPISGPPYRVSTNPTTPLTDTDPFSDGFERLVGLDPTNGADTDNDGDGLPDQIEENGWMGTIISVSSWPFEQGRETLTTFESQTDLIDSDDDGLTDLEEFFLGTNPSAKDSDSDGIDDRTEHLGYALGHKVNDVDLGFIKTDPLDADTDNDKRSDGDEAELLDIETKRWIVRVNGELPRQVYSNPLIADADFDKLVDGDEFIAKTDPNLADTDGDTREDGYELATAMTNPLAVDFQVTVFVTSLTITQDGDPVGPGDFGFDIGIRKPDSSQPAGLSNILTPIVRDSARLVAPFEWVATGERNIEPYLPSLDPGQDHQSLRDNGNGPGRYGINISDGDTLRFAGLIPQHERSVSFGMTKDEFFAIEGVVVELDSLSPDERKLTQVFLGGLDGVRVKKVAAASASPGSIRPVFFGGDLFAADERFHDLTFEFSMADNFEDTSGSGRISGSLSMYFMIG
jgi:hypothetical protein